MTKYIIVKMMVYMRGFPFMFALSFLLGIIFGMCMWIIIPVQFPVGTLVSGSVFLTTSILFFLSIRGVDGSDGIAQNHRVILKFFGARLITCTEEEGYSIAEMSEGIYAMLWRPIMTIDLHNIQLQQVTMSLVNQKTEEGQRDPKGEISSRLAIAGGAYLESVNFTTFWKEKPGLLYKTTRLTMSQEQFVRERAESHLRTAANLAVLRKSKEELERDYKNIPTLILLQSLTTLENLIAYGAEYPYDIEKSNIKAGDSVLTEDEVSNIKVCGEKIPTIGLQELLEEYGLEFAGITLNSLEIPNDIQKVIDEEMLESLQKVRELQNASTAVEISDVYMKSADKSISRFDALRIAKLDQETKGLTVHVVDGASPDKNIAAALFEKGDEK